MKWILAALVAVVGCASAVPTPTLHDVRWAQRQWPDATIDRLGQGRELYVTRCGGCHMLYEPARYAPERWPLLVKNMAKPAKLEAVDLTLISRYLSTVSARLREPQSGGGSAASSSAATN